MEPHDRFLLVCSFGVGICVFLVMNWRICFSSADYLLLFIYVVGLVFSGLLLVIMEQKSK